VPPQFTLLKIEGPDPEVLVIKPEDLPKDWMTRLDVMEALKRGLAEKKKPVEAATAAAGESEQEAPAEPVARMCARGGRKPFTRTCRSSRS
jgi:hypothetical protein